MKKFMFEASLGYIVCSRPAWAVYKNFVLKKSSKQTKKTQKITKQKTFVTKNERLESQDSKYT